MNHIVIYKKGFKSLKKLGNYIVRIRIRNSGNVRIFCLAKIKLGPIEASVEVCLWVERFQSSHLLSEILSLSP